MLCDDDVFIPRHEPPLYRDNPNKLEIEMGDTGCTVAVELPAGLKVSTRFAQPLKNEK